LRDALWVFDEMPVRNARARAHTSPRAVYYALVLLLLQTSAYHVVVASHSPLMVQTYDWDEEEKVELTYLFERNDVALTFKSKKYLKS
jgi:hypothetical protein